MNLMMLSEFATENEAVAERNLLLFILILVPILIHFIVMMAITYIVECSNGPFSELEGFEFLNPVWWYRNYKVNVFGAIIVSLLFTVLCPIFAIGYWIYKLGTIGRRK